MPGALRLLQPTTPSEASAALRELGERAKIYAGGTELLFLLRQGLAQGDFLVNVKTIPELHRVLWNGNALRIGACVTHHELETNPLIRQYAPMFARAESQVANIRVRNQGTLGGNLCFNDPHSDPGTALLVYEASVMIGGRSGQRHLPLDQFLLDMYTTALGEDELLLEVQIPPLPPGWNSAYLRLHRYQRPTLGVAAAIKEKNGNIEDVRAAVGCVGPKVQRLAELESRLRGAKLDEAGKIIGEAKGYLRELLCPVDDLLGSADYKLYMTGVLLRQAVEKALSGDNKNRDEHGIG